MSRRSDDCQWGLSRLSDYEEHYSQYPALPPQPRAVDSLEISAMGQHLLNELSDNPGRYPDNLEIHLEPGVEETAEQHYGYGPHAMSSTPRVSLPIRNTRLSHPRTTSRAPSRYESSPFRYHHSSERGSRDVTRRSHSGYGQTRMVSDQDSSSSMYRTAPSSAFTSHTRNRLYSTSRTTVDSLRDDFANDADVDTDSETPYYTPSHTPSHRSVGTRYSGAGDTDDRYVSRGPQSPLPYSGVAPYHTDRARYVLEDYDRHHG